MATRQTENEVSNRTDERQAVKRRGLIAGAAALAAGLIAKSASQPVEAADGDYVRVGYSLAGTSSTDLVTTNNSAPPYGMFFVGNTGQADSIRGQNQGSGTAGTAGVRGEIGPASGGSGVVGTFGTYNPPASGANGVYGYAAAGGSNGVLGVGPVGAQGVTGRCDGGGASYGVYGTSDVGYGGVFYGGGFSAVYALSTGGTGTGGHGVYGFANGTGGSHITAGVFGDSNTTYGLVGRTTAAGYSGLTGITSTPGVAALAASATTTAAYAAYFSGKTVVQGDFYVVSGGKFAAVPHQDGTYRGMYATEAPEPWFEDFGEGTVVNGKADVKIDPEFAALIHTGDYHAFLTEHGGYNGLHTTTKGPGGFTVATSPTLAKAAGLSTAQVQGTFSYRVVGKRKDIAGTRLPKVDLPKINIPDETKMPQHPLRGVKPIEPLGPPSAGTKQPGP